MPILPLLPLQETGGSLQCVIIGAILGVLVLILLGLMAYQRYVSGKRPVQHLCDYCGHMVSVVSDCHHPACNHNASGSSSNRRARRWCW